MADTLRKRLERENSDAPIGDWDLPCAAWDHIVKLRAIAAEAIVALSAPAGEVIQEPRWTQPRARAFAEALGFDPDTGIRRQHMEPLPPAPRDATPQLPLSDSCQCGHFKPQSCDPQEATHLCPTCGNGCGCRAWRARLAAYGAPPSACVSTAEPREVGMLTTSNPPDSDMRIVGKPLSAPPAAKDTP